MNLNLRFKKQVDNRRIIFLKLSQATQELPDSWEMASKSPLDTGKVVEY